MFIRRQSGASQDKTIKLLIEPFKTKYVYVFIASITITSLCSQRGTRSNNNLGIMSIPGSQIGGSIYLPVI